MSKKIEKKVEMSGPNNKKRPILFLIIISLILIFIIILTFWAEIFPRKFVLGLKIGNLPIGNQDSEKVKTFLDNYLAEINQTAPELVYQEKEFKPTLSELGIAFNRDKTLKNAFNYGRTGKISQKINERYTSLLWVKKLNIEMTFDEARLENYLKSISNSVGKKPVNASIKIVDGEATLSNPKPGYGIDSSKLKQDLLSVINNPNSQEKIILQEVALTPKIKEESVIPALERVLKYLSSSPIKLTTQKTEFLINQIDIGNWIKLEEDGSYLTASLDDKKINGYLKSVIEKVEIKPVDREIINGTSRVLVEGKDGLIVDQKKLNDDLKDAILNNKSSQTIEIKTYAAPRKEKTVFPPFNPSYYDGKYLDINLTEQKMRLYESQKLINEYVVSTGKWSMPTPIGTRYIENKSRKAWSDKYKLYMPYWNSIGNGYGIHELPEWPNGYKEGENHLGTPVSHGCIRLGVGPAEFVYNWAPIGTPVYIHK